MRIKNYIIDMLFISILFMSGVIIDSASASMPTVISPTPGTMLSGSTATFEWTDNGTDVENWCLRVGTTGVASKDIEVTCGPNTSRTVSGIPTDGSTIYIRLWYMVSGTWLYVDYQYLAVNLQCQPGTYRCDTGLLGECAVGICSIDVPGECIQNTQQSPELCNDGLDNDCDGQTDSEDTDCMNTECPCFNETELEFHAFHTHTCEGVVDVDYSYPTPCDQKDSSKIIFTYDDGQINRRFSFHTGFDACPDWEERTYECHSNDTGTIGITPQIYETCKNRITKAIVTLGCSHPVELWFPLVH